MENKKRLIIIDSNSVIHRAYHALPFFSTKKGERVGAIYGFLLVFLKAIKDFKPDFIVAVFDFPAPTFRHKKFKEYKAKRLSAPEELYQQIPKIKEILKIFNVSFFEKKGFEADDLIGTIAVSAPNQILSKTKETGTLFPILSFDKKDSLIETIILSNDSDMFQLVNNKTKVYLLNKQKKQKEEYLLPKKIKNIILYDEELVKEKLQGLTPEQFLDFKALRGDSSDNIPGVIGIGEKIATKLILEFSNLENLYEEIEKNSQKAQKIKLKLRETLLKHKKKAFLSKMLAKIKTDVLIDFKIEKCCWGNYNKKEAIEILKNFEFYSLIKKLLSM